MPAPIQNETIDTKEELLLLKKAKNLVFAGRGLYVFAKTTFNVKLFAIVIPIVTAMGFYFGITKTEWMMVILCAGFVITAEAFNSAIEIDIDLTSPDYHPYARDTKDVAAGAVLISAITSFIIGVMIFGPHILELFA